MCHIVTQWRTVGLVPSSDLHCKAKAGTNKLPCEGKSLHKQGFWLEITKAWGEAALEEWMKGSGRPVFPHGLIFIASYEKPLNFPSHIISFELPFYYNPKYSGCVVPFYWWGNWVSEELNNLHEVTWPMVELRFRSGRCKKISLHAL